MPGEEIMGAEQVRAQFHRTPGETRGPVWEPGAALGGRKWGWRPLTPKLDHAALYFFPGPFLDPSYEASAPNKKGLNCHSVAEPKGRFHHFVTGVR